jgi:hypothetical protein
MGYKLLNEVALWELPLIIKGSRPAALIPLWTQRKKSR